MSNASPEAPAELPAAVTAPNHAARVHSPVSPSKLNYLDPEIGGCPGYQSTSGTSAAAEAGTALHEILDAEVTAALREGWFVQHPGTKPGVTSPTLDSYLFMAGIKHRWDDETRGLVRWCARQVDPYLKGATTQSVKTEEKLDIRGLDCEHLMFGHTDLWIQSNPTSGILVDWKFGYMPVPDAEWNRQGMAYAVGKFDADPKLTNVGVMFLQPKLDWVSKGLFTRRNLGTYKATIARIKAQAETAKPADYRPGDVCKYCSRFSSCPAYLKKIGEFAATVAGLPDVVPSDSDITTPERAVVVALWADFISDKLDELKSKAKELIEANGGTATFTAPNGATFGYRVHTKNVPRRLGAAADIAHVAAETWGFTADQLLGIAEFSLGTLINTLAAAHRELVTQQTGEAPTAKDSVEAVEALLTSHGLLTSGAGQITYLKKISAQKPKPNTKKKKELNETSDSNTPGSLNPRTIEA